MKILIEESVLQQALETFTHCYAETDRRINERAKILVELRTALDAAEKVEPVAWMITTDNTNLHPLDPNKEGNWLAFDVNQFRNDSARALVISDTQPLYLHPSPAVSTETVTLLNKLNDSQLDLATLTTERDAIWESYKDCRKAHDVVTKERDELVEALKYLHKHKLWENTHGKAIIEAALAKVGADKGDK